MALLPFLCIFLQICSSEEKDRNKNWWQQAIFYQIYPRSFKDSDGDGVGDLPGILSKLDYFTYLGTEGIWLSPIYDSPMKDFGYDIRNLTAIDSLFGTMDDFKDLLKACNSRGLKLIMDFVPNHSSNECVWFEKSRLREDPYTDYYVWVDGKGPNRTEPPNNWMAMFGGSAWEWCPLRQQFYYHQYLVEQPDFNLRNPLVREELKNAFRFWLELGVSGFRVDAVKHLFEDPLLRDEPLSHIYGAHPDEYIYLSHIYTTSLPEIFDVVGEWRQLFDEFEAKDGFHRVMMVEINETIPNTVAYYGNTTRPLADMPFNFELFKITNRSTARDIHKLIADWLDGIPDDKWPNWEIGNHDQHRISNRTDVELVDAFNMINLLLKGTPVVYYGEELGMVDTEVSWEDSQDPFGLWFGPERYKNFSRDPERTPMQWNGLKFSGFTDGPKPWLPVNPNYPFVNVEVEKKPPSHLSIFRDLVSLRKNPTFEKGDVLYPIVSTNILSFVRALKSYPAYVVLINFGTVTETIDLVAESNVTAFKFPTKGIVEVVSTNVAADSPLVPVKSHIDLEALVLGPKQAVVLQFEPQW